MDSSIGPRERWPALVTFVEANLDFRDDESFTDYLVFADDGDTLFTYNINEGNFESILRVGLELLDSFDTFDELISNALSDHL